MLYSLSRMSHAHTEGPSASAALATMLPQREARRDWLPRLPRWLDPLSTLIALKTGIGLVIAVTIALWLGWSPTGAAFACLMLQTTYLGRTLGRSILRMAGALAGSLVAMTLISTLVQERAALITAYALLTGLIVYLEQESEHPYALLFVLFSVGTITFGTINEPELAFSKAVSWVSGNALGITIVLIMHGVLWPHTGEKSFEQQLHTFLQGLSHLFALKVAALPHAAAVSGETPQPVEPEQIRQLEARLIAALAQLRLALGIASRDTPRIARFAQSYDALLDDLQSLTSLLIAYGENLRIWRTTAVAAELVPGSNAARVVMHALQAQLDDLAAGCERARDGTGSTQGDEPCRVVEAQLESSHQRLHASQHTMLEAAAFDAVSEKAVQASRAIAAVRDALATVEHPGRRAARTRRSQVDVITRIQSPALRLQKALVGTVAVALASLMWIGLDWPMPSSLMVFAIIPPAFNAMVASFPVKAALKSLFWGPAIAAVLYFGVMPALTGMWQLAPILVLALFPNAYRTNSANPATMLSSLFSNLWVISLIDLSQGQVYSFSAFANNAIGIVGGVGVGVATLAFFIPARPEHRFKGLVRTFVLRCEQAIAGLRPQPQTAPGVSPELEARRAEWLELLSLSEMWAGQLDERRHPQEERARLGAFIESLWAVAFRLEALEEARQRYPDESLIEEPCARCRAMAAAVLDALRAQLAGSAPAAVPSAGPAIAEAFGAALEPLHEAAHRRDEIVDALHQALTLTGYYHAVAQALDECQERAAAIDWRRWDEAYF